MWGLIVKLRVMPGQRDRVIGILLAGTRRMPGCLSYIVARDAADGNVIWVTEVWESQASHTASLALPEVKQAVTEAKPLVTAMESRTITEPAGGVGLAKTGQTG